MSNKKKKSRNNKGAGKQVSLQIYARVRCLMPWEPEKVSLKICGPTKIQNKTKSSTNEYLFSKVFTPKQTNSMCFDEIVMPMVANVLMGFNAVLIAYGQTGSGKTFSMLGKPKLGIVGILPMMLQYLVKQQCVKSVELSAVEAFGHHIAKIHLYDLFNEVNQDRDWMNKKGDTSLDVKKANSVTISDAHDAHDKIIFAHGGSHFAPTGKNPESSRGHVTFVSKVTQIIDHTRQVSYFVMVDCAGSEGESAFTKQYISSVDKETLMARRLEAGCINTGLSQLQIIFNELRLKGKLSNAVGNGLRRVLHPYINTKTYLSVLFCLSPSVTNARPTEATLKFAVTAGMVKVSPIAAKKKINFESLVDELKAHIKYQEEVIEANNDKAEKIEEELNAVKMDILDLHDKEERDRIAEIEEQKRKEEQMDEDAIKAFRSEVRQQSLRKKKSQFNIRTDSTHSSIFSPKAGDGMRRTLTLSSCPDRIISLELESHERIESHVPMELEISLAALDKQQEDEAAALYSVMTDEHGDVVDPVQRVKFADDKADKPMVVNAADNDEAMDLAINAHKRIQTESKTTVTQFAKDFGKLIGSFEQKDDDAHQQRINAIKAERDKDMEAINLKEYDVGYAGGSYDEYLRLKGIEYKKLSKEDLDDYAMQQWMFYQQEISVKKNLQQATNVITDYLQEEFEGLLSFFRVRKILPKQRIDIQW
eukprot:189867_1